jgi:hypothetical protein
MLESVCHDLRFGLRVLRRSPAFTAAARSAHTGLQARRSTWNVERLSALPGVVPVDYRRRFPHASALGGVGLCYP